ncbi:hypothetical protein AB1Y20_000959 [Prymnesium parvum]|uniref:Uncharacterized protein n=1 Tax=Prymnesium parvum TaxID=97485 RepID=A0AB34KBY1_PRYPA
MGGTVVGEETDSAEDLAGALHSHGDALAVELDRLSHMVQVKLTEGSVFDRAKPRGSVARKRGVICKLLCCGRQLDQKCNELIGDSACPTHVEAARMLVAKVEKYHSSAECLEKARLRSVAEDSSRATTREPPLNALAAMMQRPLAKQRAVAALKASEKRMREAEAEHVEARQAVERLADDKSKHQTAEEDGGRDDKGEAAALREPVKGVQRPTPPEGVDGALDHWRRGLSGAVRDWAVGSMDNVCILLVRLIRRFKIEKEVVQAIAGAELKSATVDAAIVSNIGQALNVLSKRQTEQQRREAGTLLRAVASPPATQMNSNHGSNESIARRLGEFVGQGRHML